MARVTARHLRRLATWSWMALATWLPTVVCAQEARLEDNPQIMVHRVDRRTLSDKALSVIGLSDSQVGRSFALVAGVENYPGLQDNDKTLPAAGEDLRKLVKYLKEEEFFDEIVLLKDEDVTEANLKYFLQFYFPQRVKKFPNSRFLLAYSGHGFQDQSKEGFLLQSDAVSMKDKVHAIDLSVVRVFVNNVVKNGHQVLVLLNSCYSGAFLERAFGDKELPLEATEPGAHVITAGEANQLTWAIDKYGTGSVFYEKLFAGLNGLADANRDGVVTFDELTLYLKREVALATSGKQIPKAGDISRDGSNGSFFFLNRKKQVDAKSVPEWKGGAASGPAALSTPTKTLASNPSTPPNAPKPIQAELSAAHKDCDVCPEMVAIPAGSFLMGSPWTEEGYWDTEGPQTTVTVAPFQLSAAPVTRGQFAEFVKDTGYQAGSSCTFWETKKKISAYGPGFDWRNPGFEGLEQTDTHPVVCVSWNDAQAYASWLSKRTGQQYRLPTEAEWEYAARAGTTTARYWGDDPESDQACAYANVADRTAKAKVLGSSTVHECDDGYAYTSPVGSFKPNAWGLYDMLGNVWQWTEDCWHGSNKNRPTDGAAWMAGGGGDCGRRGARGGSWINGPGSVRSASRGRGGLDPSSRVSYIGFRVARTLP
jgi:formylglycine-generating enzyme required for sulfatase activity